MKTINMSNREDFYQSDTGPVLFPLAGPATDLTIDRLHLAYVAQSGGPWAEFIVNTPTAIAQDLSVDHYATPVRTDAKNELFVLD